MEYNQFEIANVIAATRSTEADQIVELDGLQLALIGGGIADVIAG